MTGTVIKRGINSYRLMVSAGFDGNKKRQPGSSFRSNFLVTSVSQISFSGTIHLEIKRVLIQEVVNITPAIDQDNGEFLATPNKTARTFTIASVHR